MGEKFVPPIKRDRKVILEDIYETERIMRMDMSEEDRKKWLKIKKELKDELSYTKPSLFERIFKR